MLKVSYSHILFVAKFVWVLLWMNASLVTALNGPQKKHWWKACSLGPYQTGIREIKGRGLGKTTICIQHLSLLQFTLQCPTPTLRKYLPCRSSIYMIYIRAWKWKLALLKTMSMQKWKAKAETVPLKKKLQAPTSNPYQLSSNEACASLKFEPAWSTSSMYSCLVANHGGLAMY